jgi:hypothetical protein
MIVETEEATVPDRGDVISEVTVHEAFVKQGYTGIVGLNELAFDKGNALRESAMIRLMERLACTVF